MSKKERQKINYPDTRESSHVDRGDVRQQDNVPDDLKRYREDVDHVFSRQTSSRGYDGEANHIRNFPI